METVENLASATASVGLERPNRADRSTLRCAGRSGITRTGDAEKIFGKSANFTRDTLGVGLFPRRSASHPSSYSDLELNSRDGEVYAKCEAREAEAANAEARLLELLGRGDGDCEKRQLAPAQAVQERTATLQRERDCPAAGVRDLSRIAVSEAARGNEPLRVRPRCSSSFSAAAVVVVDVSPPGGL